MFSFFLILSLFLKSNSKLQIHTKSDLCCVYAIVYSVVTRWCYQSLMYWPPRNITTLQAGFWTLPTNTHAANQLTDSRRSYYFLPTKGQVRFCLTSVYILVPQGYFRMLQNCSGNCSFKFILHFPFCMTKQEVTKDKFDISVNCAIMHSKHFLPVIVGALLWHPPSEPFSFFS